MVEEKIICNKTLHIKCIWGEKKKEQRKVGSWDKGLKQKSNHFCELIWANPAGQQCHVR